MNYLENNKFNEDVNIDFCILKNIKFLSEKFKKSGASIYFNGSFNQSKSVFESLLIVNLNDEKSPDSIYVEDILKMSDEEILSLVTEKRVELAKTSDFWNSKSDDSVIHYIYYKWGNSFLAGFNYDEIEENIQELFEDNSKLHKIVTQSGTISNEILSDDFSFYTGGPTVRLYWDCVIESSDFYKNPLIILKNLFHDNDIFPEKVKAMEVFIDSIHGLSSELNVEATTRYIYETIYPELKNPLIENGSWEKMENNFSLLCDRDSGVDLSEDGNYSILRLDLKKILFNEYSGKYSNLKTFLMMELLESNVRSFTKAKFSSAGSVIMDFFNAIVEAELIPIDITFHVDGINFTARYKLNEEGKNLGVTREDIDAILEKMASTVVASPMIVSTSGSNSVIQKAYQELSENSEFKAEVFSTAISMYQNKVLGYKFSNMDVKFSGQNNDIGFKL